MSHKANTRLCLHPSFSRKDEFTTFKQDRLLLVSSFSEVSVIRHHDYGRPCVTAGDMAVKAQLFFFCSINSFETFACNDRN